MPRVLIADDHPLFRGAVRDVVARLFAERGWEFDCLETTDLTELLRVTETAEDLDLILLDLFMPGAQGLSHLVALRSRLPATPVVIISSLSDPATVRQAIVCGAAGFLPKSAGKAEIAAALQAVFAGDVYVPEGLLAEAKPGRPDVSGGDAETGPLTARQLAVLALLADGKANKQIAWELSISETTVKVHITAILRKLRVSSRAQAIVMFQRNLVPPSLTQTGGDPSR